MRSLTGALLIAILVVGCAKSSSPGANGPLVTVETRGGECLVAPCGMTIAIERDGRIHRIAPDEAALGTVPAGILAALLSQIRSTDFALVASRPFTGECPTNFDGQEIVYVFGAPSGVQRIASCEVEADPDMPVFAAVEAALAASGS